MTTWRCSWASPATYLPYDGDWSPYYGGGLYYLTATNGRGSSEWDGHGMGLAVGGALSCFA